MQNLCQRKPKLDQYKLEKKILHLQKLADRMADSPFWRISYLCSNHVMHAWFISVGFIFYFILKAIGCAPVANITLLIAVPSIVCMIVFFPSFVILTFILEKAVNIIEMKKNLLKQQINHDWDGCICRKCGAENHNWYQCKCLKCGKVEHNWNSCICRKCGAIRNEQHEWDDSVCRK